MRVSLRPFTFLAIGILALFSVFFGVNVPRAAANTAHARQIFAPYQDVTISGTVLQSVLKKTGQHFYTLAFITNGGGTCNAEWAGSIPFDQTAKLLPHLSSDIDAVRDAGGDVIISFGGAAGTELALTCQDPLSLQAQYQRVIDTYHINRLDFDIEGGTQGDVPSYTRRNIALAALQKANPHLIISFTLPAATTGLLDNSLGLLRNAKAEGVNFSIVNIMPFDFGSPEPMMGQQAINSANGFFQQLQQIFPDRSDRQIWSMIGVTLLIGQNDSPGEIFTEHDGHLVFAFAQQHHLGFLSYWEVSRDNGDCPGNPSDQDNCSGLKQRPFAFLKLFQPFGEDEDI